MAPALLGGMIISVQDKGKVYYESVKIADNLRFCAIIPDFTLSTSEARAALPKQLTYSDAVFNISRAALLVTALANGNCGLIKHACEDALHQPYRSKLISGYDDIVRKCKELGCLSVFLSGAGPTIMAVTKSTDKDFASNLQEFLNTLENKWTVKELNIDNQGTVISKVCK